MARPAPPPFPTNHQLCPPLLLHLRTDRRNSKRIVAIWTNASLVCTILS
jgi:hypothetical protein